MRSHLITLHASMIIPFAYFLVLLCSCNAAEAAIGMNWGRHTAQRLIPSQVVDLLLQNGIKEARVYTAQEDILQAFAGSGIHLTVNFFQVGQIKTLQDARTIIGKKMPLFSAANVSRVYVGNQVFLQGQKDKPFLNQAIDACEFVQQALDEAGASRIKATLPHDINAILKDNITKPSEAEFRDEIKQEMIRFVDQLKANDGPFVYETFPISRIELHDDWDISFAFFDTDTIKSKQAITDVHGAVYTNYFEFEYDSVVWALEKIGAPDVKIVVGQVGWPTDGYPGATLPFAERFYKGFLPYLVSNKGTPKRPGSTVDAYLHGLTDENRTPVFWPHMRHWGIYRSNGEPKFKIDLSGRGRDIFPSNVKGINRMPERWCVFNGASDRFDGAVNSTFTQACDESDCTSLAPGASCSGLSWKKNVSYAYNMYFQSQFQDEKACQFDGLAKIVTRDPSIGNCVFPVEVVQGKQDDFMNLFMNGDGTLKVWSSMMGGGTGGAT